MPLYQNDINTNDPVAVQLGQSVCHVPSEAPWHLNPTTLKCSDCDVSYVVDQGFSREYLLTQLKDDHAKNRQHAVYIASEPAFTTLTECKCK